MAPLYYHDKPPEAAANCVVRVICYFRRHDSGDVFARCWWINQNNLWAWARDFWHASSPLWWSLVCRVELHVLGGSEVRRWQHKSLICFDWLILSEGCRPANGSRQWEDVDRLLSNTVIIMIFSFFVIIIRTFKLWQQVFVLGGGGHFSEQLKREL